MPASIIPRLRVALTGFGQVAADVHLPVLRRMPGVEVVAIADVDPGRRALARQLAPQVSAYESQEVMLAQSDVEAVIICAPSQWHADHAIAALQSGKHVYLEKPAATTLADAWRLAETGRRSDRVGMLGFNYRFSPLIQSARRQMKAGRIGELRYVRTTFSLAPREMPDWKASRRMGGGVLLDLASHHVDLIPYLCAATVDEASARIWSRRKEDDCAALQLTLSNGATVQSFFSSCAVDEDSIEIYGDRGKLSLNRYSLYQVRFTSADGYGGPGRRFRRWIQELLPPRAIFEKLRSPLHEASYPKAMARFVANVRGGNGEYPDFEDGLRCQEILEAAEESSRTCRVVPCAAPPFV